MGFLRFFVCIRLACTALLVFRTSSRKWYFFTDADPTGGNVNYLSQQDAMNQGLAYVDSDNSVVLAVDSTSSVPAGGFRNS